MKRKPKIGDIVIYKYKDYTKTIKPYPAIVLHFNEDTKELTLEIFGAAISCASGHVDKINWSWPEEEPKECEHEYVEISSCTPVYQLKCRKCCHIKEKPQVNAAEELINKLWSITASARSLSNSTKNYPYQQYEFIEAIHDLIKEYKAK